MKHADAFKVDASEYGVAIKCSFCGTRIMALRHETTWRSAVAIVKNHVCHKLREALDVKPVLVGQVALSDELGLCNSAYRPDGMSAATVILCSGHHPLDAETHSGGGYIWQDTEAENYA